MASRVFQRKHNLAGECVGRLTVVSPAPRPEGRNGTFWLCRCSCGNEKLVTTISLLRQKTKSCGCLAKEIRPGTTKANREYRKSLPQRQLDPRAAVVNDLFYKCRFWSQAHGMQSDLERSDIARICFSPCYYCGIAPAQVVVRRGKRLDAFPYNGIDRVDNSLGYTADNVRPCCWQCNSSKGDRTEEDFLGWVERCYSYQHDAKSP